MKKKQLTFAEEAKRIMNKYKSRLGKDLDKDDPLAKKAMERELSELAAQQEMMKQSMQMDNMEGGQGGQAMPAPAMMVHGGTIPELDPNVQWRKGMTQRYGMAPYTGTPFDPSVKMNNDIPLDVKMNNDVPPNVVLNATPETTSMFPLRYDEGTYSVPVNIPAGPYSTPSGSSILTPGTTLKATPGVTHNITPDGITTTVTGTKDGRVVDSGNSNNSSWTMYASPALQAAGSIASAIASKTMSGNNADVEFNGPQAAPYKMAYFDEARRQAMERNRLGKASVRGGKYVAAAATQHYDNQLARELAGIQEQENNFNVRGLNEYNQAMHGFGMKAAENRMQAQTINAGLRAAGDKETAAYINETFNKAAIYPENVARLDAFNKTLPYMGTAFSGSDGNGKFISPAMGLKYYPDSGKYFIDGKEVDNTDLYFEQLKKRRIDNSPSYMAKVKE